MAWEEEEEEEEEEGASATPLASAAAEEETPLGLGASPDDGVPFSTLAFAGEEAVAAVAVADDGAVDKDEEEGEAVGGPTAGGSDFKVAADAVAVAIPVPEVEAAAEAAAAPSSFLTLVTLGFFSRLTLALNSVMTTVTSLTVTLW